MWLWKFECSLNTQISNRMSEGLRGLNKRNAASRTPEISWSVESTGKSKCHATESQMCSSGELQERRFKHQRRDMKDAQWKKTETKANPLMQDLKKEPHTFTAQRTKTTGKPKYSMTTQKLSKPDNSHGSQSKHFWGCSWYVYWT